MSRGRLSYPGDRGMQIARWATSFFPDGPVSARNAITYTKPATIICRRQTQEPVEYLSQSTRIFISHLTLLTRHLSRMSELPIPTPAKDSDAK